MPIRSESVEAGAAPDAPVATARRGRKAVAVEPSATPATPAVIPAAERDDHTLGAIEAVLLSVDRPVSSLRLAEALGWVDSLEDAMPASDAEPDSAEATPAGGKKKSKAGAPPSPVARIRAAIATLNDEYAATGRAFRIEAVAGGFRFMTLARFAPVVENFLGKRERTALSRAAVETLAIIAYKQPLTRATLEAIRGVACGEVLRTLVDRRLVTITGRAEELGRPMLYGTTKQFLEAFGLSSLKDLPTMEEFRARHKSDEDDAGTP